MNCISYEAAAMSVKHFISPKPKLSVKLQDNVEQFKSLASFPAKTIFFYNHIQYSKLSRGRFCPSILQWSGTLNDI